MGNWLSPEAGRLYREKILYYWCAFIFFVTSNVDVLWETFAEPAMTEIALYVAAPVFHLWKALVPSGLSPAYELRGWVLA